MTVIHSHYKFFFSKYKNLKILYIIYCSIIISKVQNASKYLKTELSFALNSTKYLKNWTKLRLSYIASKQASVCKQLKPSLGASVHVLNTRAMKVIATVIVY